MGATGRFMAFPRGALDGDRHLFGKKNDGEPTTAQVRVFLPADICPARRPSDELEPPHTTMMPR